jgi:alkanesulfonate monooxygenase SsuD/methylene tetrahydromethanopterin reductase-like flavin-dependent oxidoreductase (luciferase family)
MTGRAFRFGVIATPHGGAEEWRATARRAAELGYDSLLMPDGLQLLAPGPALAVATTAADIRVGTWVYAAPLRPARATAWEAHSLTVLTGGRFEMGIGTGRPAVEQFTRELGLPFGSPQQRLAQVAETIDALRELDGPGLHTPVLVAAGGPRARALAAARADIVTLAIGPLTPREAVAEMVRDLRAKAAGRADDIEVALSVFVVGEQVPPHTERYIGADAATLIAQDSLAMLRGTTAQMISELQRRRDTLGISYLAVGVEFAEQLAPVVEALAHS